MSGALEVKVTGVPVPVAEAVREAYETAHGNDLPEHVLALAEKGDKRLVGYFEWDDAVAGREYRLVQAQMLVRRVKVQILRAEDEPPIRVRAYVARRDLTADSEDEVRPGGYVAIEEVAGQSAWESSVTEAIQRDLIRLKRKYQDVELLWSLADEVFND